MARCIYVRVGQVYAWAGLVSVAGSEGLVVSWGAGSSCRVVRMHGHRGNAHVVGHPVGPDERWIVTGGAGRRGRRQRRQRRRRRRGRRRRGWRRRGRGGAWAQSAPSRTKRIVKRGIARPCATDEDLVCVGQTSGLLPSLTGAYGEMACGAGRPVAGGVGRRRYNQRAGGPQLRRLLARHARSAR